MSEQANELMAKQQDLASVSNVDDMDCFGATRPILMFLFALWGGLMIAYAFTAS